MWRKINKCHHLCLALALLSVVLAESDPALSPNEELTAEHRAAKPEPFLDRIAAFFGASTGPNQDRLQSSASVQRPTVLRPRPQSPPQIPLRPQPTYNRPKPPAVAPPQRIDSYQQPSNNFPTIVSPGPGFTGGNADPWQQTSPSNMAMIKDLQVQCEKDLMRVRIIFDRPFYGMVFSKGHYSNVNCVHVPSGLGQTQATFDISLQSCGMTSSVNDNYGSPTPQGSYIENTIIIQYDPLLQEVWDQARRLRCTWYDFYEKAVTFRPYQVDMLDPVTANFLGDNLRCWMQIQVGKGPHASEVSGIVKIGQTMTMVLGVKDDENKFDMMVRNCVAHDGSRAPIQLVDEKGCVSRPKIMSPFKKLKNFDATANVLAYAYFQAFKFPDSMNVHFQCVVQVCRGSCPEPQCGGISGGGGIVPNTDSYGSPAASVLSNYGGGNFDSYGSPNAPALDSYGSPLGTPFGSSNSAINPRLPSKASQRQFVAGSELNPKYVKPPSALNDKLDGDEEEDLVDQVPEKLVLSEPGYGDFNKRSGVLPTMSLGGKPRKLDIEKEDEEKSRDAKSALKDVNTVDSSTGDDFTVVPEESKPERKRRHVGLDANGNRILKVVKRDAMEMAEVETTEKIIQVLAPNDVQFALPFTTPDGRSGEGQSDQLNNPEVVIHSNAYDSSALCVDTSAFVGVTVTFIMILVVALITIVFLWLRIKSLQANPNQANMIKKRCF